VLKHNKFVWVIDDFENIGNIDYRSYRNLSDTNVQAHSKTLKI